MFLFLGTIGVDVFAHICNEDGTELSYFSPDDSFCSDHDHDKHVDNEKKMYCDEENKSCEKPEPTCCDEKEDNNCCETNYAHIQVKLDFANKVIVKPVIIPESILLPVWFEQEKIEVSSVQFASNSDPPPLEQSDRLTLIQSWLI